MRTSALGLAIAASLAIGTGAAHAAAGGLDPTFGTGGLVTFLEPGVQRANRIVAQPDGKLIVVGSTSSGPGADGLVRRLNPDGTPDRLRRRRNGHARQRWLRRDLRCGAAARRQDRGRG